MTRWLAVLLIVALPLADLAWNLTHLNIGLVDFYGLTLPALGFVQHGVWPATPYFPAGYPLLLIPFGYMGSTLVGGYILCAVGAMLALWGVRRLALELGAPQEWTLAAIGLAWAEPCFRVTAGSPTPDMLFTGLGVWFLLSAVRVWRQRIRQEAEDQPIRLQFLREPSIYFLLLTLPLLQLRHHAAALVVPLLAALLLWRRMYPSVLSGLLLIAAGGIGFSSQGHSSAAALQIRVGLEASQPTYYESTEALFANYASFAEHARGNSIIADYGMPRIAQHTLSEWIKYLRRPPVVLALMLWLAALFLRRLDRGLVPLALWILAYSLALSVAYYTPRAALLPVVVAVALVVALVPRLAPRRADLALGAACMLLLAAYWPAGKFARADMAQRRHFAEASRRAAESIREMGVDPDTYVTTDMRVIRLPALDNPWQLPFKHLGGQTWLDDPAIEDEQLPGYRTPETESDHGEVEFKPASPAP